MNLTTTQHISVDLIGNRYKTATVKQNDLATRYINVAITLNGQAYPLSNDVTCYLRFMPPNGGQPQLQSCRVETDGTVTFEVASSMVTTVGKARANIDIKQTNPADPATQQLLSTVVFYIMILPSAYGDDVLVASDELSPLEQLIQEAEAGCNNAIQTMEVYKENGKYYSEDAYESAKEAEAWAHGDSFIETETYVSEGSATHTLEYIPYSITSVEVNGEPISDYTLVNKTITFTTAPALGVGVKIVYVIDTSEDNAKYYKELANASANIASSSATNAMDSAEKSAASATESTAYAIGGNYYKVDDFVGDGTTSTFALSETPMSILSVKIDGETIQPNQYTASGSNLVFYSIVPDDGAKIKVIFSKNVSNSSKYYSEQSQRYKTEASHSAIESDAYARGGYFNTSQIFFGDGSTTTFTLDNTPDDIYDITIDGTAVSDYTVSGKVITFTTAPDEYSMIQVSYSADMTNDNAKYYKEQIVNYINGIYRYVGQVNTYADLPSSGQANGDVYDILTDDPTHGIIAGDNVAWNGTSWDKLAGAIAVMVGATATTNGAKGLVPTPMIADRNKFLRGDGTWAEAVVSDMRGATSSADGAHGLVPAPTAIDYQKYLRGDGTWARMYGGLVISAADYQALVAADQDDPNETYFIYDEGSLPDGSSYMQKGLDRVTAGKRNGTTLGFYATAEGGGVVASGDYAHAEGEETSATGHGAHSEGTISSASGHSSHAEGRGTKASSYAQHVEGRYNVEDVSDTYAHITGGGSDGDHRKNIHTLDWNGNAVYEGDVSGKDANNNVISLRGLKSDIQDVYEAMGKNGAKNLIPFPYDGGGVGTHTVNGISFIVNPSGSISISGTATADAEFTLAGWLEDILEDEKDYIVSAEGINGSLSTYYLSIEKINRNMEVTSTVDVINDEVQFTASAYKMDCILKVKSGQTISSVTIYPMIRFASDTDDTYQPYAMTNKQLTDNLSGKANTATTLAGYGITNAYTKTEVDTALSNKAGALVTQNFSNTSELTVAANNYDAISVDITKQGYTPIAIVKIWAMPQGILPIGGFYIYNNNGTDYAVVRYINPTSSSQSCSKRSLEFTILYVKN